MSLDVDKRARYKNPNGVVMVAKKIILECIIEDNIVMLPTDKSKRSMYNCRRSVVGNLLLELGLI